MGRVSDAKEKLMDAVRALIWEGSYGSTTIDQICAKAGVRKGSFYYFFKSKADLAVVALEAECEMRRPDLDAIFSPVVPPLERLRRYCEYGFELQAEAYQKCGRVLGCPLFTLGAEVSTQEDRLRGKIEEILLLKRRYLESAISDAHTAGLINAPDSEAKARMLFAFYQGIVTEARIKNSLAPLENAVEATFDLLGAENPAPSST